MKTKEILAITIPTLENGDRLTRYEFERRYEAMPPLGKSAPSPKGRRTRVRVRQKSKVKSQKEEPPK